MKESEWIIGGIKTNELGILSNNFSFNSIKIENPIHGAILNRRHGVEIAAGLRVKVEGRAPFGKNVIVNGLPAMRDGEKFSVEIIIYDKKNEIIAVTDTSIGQLQHKIQVLWDQYSFPRYGFEIDDNIFFLRDIANKKYKSIFECFYLKKLRNLHKKYATKILLNLFYTDGSLYSNKPEFTLEQFPEHYKKEWEDNADWLKLTFHAYSEFPDRPYQNALVKNILNDIDLIAEQIKRFAGEKSYTAPTIVHWGMTNHEAFKPLYDNGVRILRGDFTKNEQGFWDINYNLDNKRSKYLSRNNFLKDFDSGIIFGKTNIVLNNTPIDQIVPILETLKNDPNQAEIMDVITHEQYFWPFYANYLPDHFDLLDTFLCWVSENGYKPVFWNEDPLLVE